MNGNDRQKCWNVELLCDTNTHSWWVFLFCSFLCFVVVGAAFAVSFDIFQMQNCHLMDLISDVEVSHKLYNYTDWNGFFNFFECFPWDVCFFFMTSNFQLPSNIDGTVATQNIWRLYRSNWLINTSSFEKLICSLGNMLRPICQIESFTSFLR